MSGEEVLAQSDLLEDMQGIEDMMALAQLETEKWCPKYPSYRQCQKNDLASRCPDECYFFAQVNEEDMHGIEDMQDKMALAQLETEKWCPKYPSYRQCQRNDLASRCPDECYFFAQVNEEDMHGIEDM